MMPPLTANHCTCAGCRRLYAWRYGELCECPNCTGPIGPHRALYNRYRPSRLGPVSKG
jgi:hypothetical protein